MSSASAKAVKKAEMKEMKQAVKDLSATQKQQEKIHKAVLKAENKLARVQKKESAANAALIKATNKHDDTVSSVQDREKKLNDRKEQDLRLQQEIEQKKAQVESARNRGSTQGNLGETPAIIGAPALPAAGTTSGLSASTGAQNQPAAATPPTGQPRNLAAEAPSANLGRAAGPGSQQGNISPMPNAASPNVTVPQQQQFGAFPGSQGQLPSRDPNFPGQAPGSGSGLQGDQNLPNQAMAGFAKNMGPSKSTTSDYNQSDNISGPRGISSRMQPSPLATHEPVTHAGGNPSAHDTGLGQSQADCQQVNAPSSAQSGDPMRPPGGSPVLCTKDTLGSTYGTPPENPGPQGGNEGNLAGIGAGGTAPMNTSTVPAGGVTHPVTGDTVGNPGATNLLKTTGSQDASGTAGSGGPYLYVPGFGQTPITSDVAKKVLSGDMLR